MTRGTSGARVWCLLVLGTACGGSPLPDAGRVRDAGAAADAGPAADAGTVAFSWRPIIVDPRPVVFDAGIVIHDAGIVIHDAGTAAVDAGTEYALVAAARNGTCAIEKDLSLWCWGAPWGTSAPQQIGTANEWVFTDDCAIKRNGTLWCPAAQADGGVALDQIGDAGSWSTVSTSLRHFHEEWIWRDTRCAIRSDGSLWCWGPLSPTGPLDPTWAWVGGNTEPEQYRPDVQWQSVELSDITGCALSNSGALHCWSFIVTCGYDDCVSYDRRNTEVAGSWNEVAVGPDSTCAIRNDGSLWCWLNTLVTSSGPTLTLAPSANVGATDWQHIAVAGSARSELGISHGSSFCGLKVDGSLWCWGQDLFGVTATGTPHDSPVPVEVAPGTAWLEISAGDQHFCGRRRDMTVSCWGWSALGQLGGGAYPRAVGAVGP